MDTQALWLTLKLATVTTFLLLCLAIPLSRWLVFGKSRWKSVIEAIATLPLLLPPTVLGFYLLVLLGPRTAPGRFLIHLIGHPIARPQPGLAGISSLMEKILVFGIPDRIRNRSDNPRHVRDIQLAMSK